MISFAKLCEAEMESGYLLIEIINDQKTIYAGIIFRIQFYPSDLIVIRCAAHTLQLAIKDSIEKADVNECILMLGSWL